MNAFFFRALFVVVAAVGGVACSFENSAAEAARQEFASPELREAQAEIDRNPNFASGHTNLAMLLMKESRRTGDFSLQKQAGDSVTRALAISPADITARKLAASLHLSFHRFKEAIAAATELQREFPSDAFLHGVLADAYMEVGDYPNAVKSAQTMVDLKPGTASYARVAQLRSLHGDHRGAIEMFMLAARSADPSDKETQSWCLVQLGDEHWKAGDFAKAEKMYDESLANLPDYFFAMVAKGRVRASVGDYATAERLLIDVQKEVPNAKAIHLLGDIYAIRGEDQKAAEQYAKFDAIEADLGDAADHNRMALSWADRGRIEEALEVAKNEYANEPSIYSADLLAWSLFKTGEFSEAKKYIGEAMRLKTDDARILYHAGMIEKGLGNKAEARRLLEHALRRNPSFDLLRAVDARTALAELKAPRS